MEGGTQILAQSVDVNNELSIEASEKGFLNYHDANNPRNSMVHDFYRNNRKNMTLSYVLETKHRVCKLDQARMTLWDALLLLADIVDDSDPDTSLSQLEHALQTAEGCRLKFPNEDWMHLVGLIHDCGKFLCHPKGYNMPSWTAHGDSFPVGCSFSQTCVLSEYFENNPDTLNPQLNTLYGIYEPNCGLDNVHMSFGHDEYMYWVLKNNDNCKLNEEALYIVRYHSFHPFHYHGDYLHLANMKDLKYLPKLKDFARLDLYTKATESPDLSLLESYYKPLIEKYCPGELRW